MPTYTFNACTQNPSLHYHDEITLFTVCPDGYEYAGDDTPKLTRDFLLEEAYRSPTYSCYKINSRSPKAFLQAAFECEEDKG